MRRPEGVEVLYLDFDGFDTPIGITVWHPTEMPAPLLARPLSDIPGAWATGYSKT